MEGCHGLAVHGTPRRTGEYYGVFGGGEESNAVGCPVGGALVRNGVGNTVGST